MADQHSCYGIEISEEARALVTEFSDAAFDCGEFDAGDGGDYAEVSNIMTFHGAALAQYIQSLERRAAHEPAAVLPEGFNAIADDRLAEHLAVAESVTLRSALIELQMRRAAQPPASAMRAALEPFRHMRIREDEFALDASGVTLGYVRNKFIADRLNQAFAAARALTEKTSTTDEKSGTCASAN